MAQHRALITGASGAIGASCARTLKKAGMDLVLCYHKGGDRAISLAEELGAEAFPMDVSDPRSVEEVFSVAGAVDVLVTAAGVSFDALLSDTDDTLWQKTFAVNCDGTFYCCRRAAPRMLRMGWGRIITVSGVEVTRDASYATCYVTPFVLADEDREAVCKEVLAAFNSAKGVFRTQIGRDIKMRQVPELIFKLDTSMDYGRHIDAILEEIRQEEAPADPDQQ